MKISEAEATGLGFLESPAAQLVLQFRRIAACNRALARLFGYDRTELLGQSVRSSIHQIPISNGSASAGRRGSGATAAMRTSASCRQATE